MSIEGYKMAVDDDRQAHDDQSKASNESKQIPNKVPVPKLRRREPNEMPKVKCPKCGAWYAFDYVDCQRCGYHHEGTIEELMTPIQIKRAKEARSFVHSLGRGSWDLVFVSGVISGAVGAFAFTKLKPGTALPVVGFAYAFCILNPAFRFTWLERLVATGIMLFMAMTGWYLILEFFKSTY